MKAVEIPLELIIKRFRTKCFLCSLGTKYTLFFSLLMIIGIIFLLIAVMFGEHTLILVHLLPLSVLGVLLVFAGAQLGLTVIDMHDRKEFFVILLIVGITLAANLAAGFLVGILIDRLISRDHFSI